MQLLKTSMEGIDFQENSPLALDLNIALQKLRKLPVVKDKDVKESNLTGIIRKHTGLLVDKIILSEMHFAATTIPDLSKNNPMISMVKQYFTGKDAKKFINKNKVVDGTINLKTGKLSGDFTKIPVHILLAPSLLESASFISVDELTAIILHEIGHSLVQLEMLARHTRTNAIIAEATERAMEMNTSEQRIQLFESVEDAFGVKMDGKDELAVKRRGQDVYRTVFMTMAIEESKSQHGENLYDFKTFEVLADQFAIRHGYGKPLATGLDKVGRRFGGDPAYLSPATHHFVQLATAITVLGTYAILGTALVMGNIVVIPHLIITTVMLLSVSDPLAQPHPRNKERFGHIRRELTNSLKKGNLSRENKQEVLSDIDVVTKLEESLHDHDDLLNYFYKNITPWGRKQVNLRKVQLELNEMANNRLFVASANLTA